MYLQKGYPGTPLIQQHKQVWSLTQGLKMFFAKKKRQNRLSLIQSNFSIFVWIFYLCAPSVKIPLGVRNSFPAFHSIFFPDKNI